MSASYTPFEISIPQGDLDDLRARLAVTRLPNDHDNDDWTYGTNTAYLRELLTYWRDEYDWRVHERAMNALPNYRGVIDGVPIHFAYIRGKGPKSRPLILTHGWPWTFWDYRKMIGPLTDPESYGADQHDSFDVVIPSLPGFGFSPTDTKHICWIETADMWVRLMRDVLGYDTFLASGSDWGRQITTQLGHAHADSVAAIHVNGAGTIGAWNRDRPWDVFGDPPTSLSSDERTRVIEFQRHYSSHVAVHVLGPQTLANAIHDSPAGLCSWILERRRWWSDCHGEIESVFPKDDLLTTISIYWFTETFVSSVRYYREASRHRWEPSHANSPLVQVPSSISVFPDAPLAPDEGELHATYNLQQMRVHERGGHFAPVEVPELVVEDIRDAFRQVGSSPPKPSEKP